MPQPACPSHPQPVPPIFQPEVPAETIYHAAHHRRREIVCGGSAALAILASKLAPQVADRYLARTGFDSQQMRGRPVAPGRPDNLFHPVPGMAATHGIFDDRAHARSLHAWLTTHRGAVVGAMGGATVAIAAVGRLVR